MPRLKIVLVVIVLLIITLACSTFLGTDSPESSSTSTPLVVASPTLEAASSCSAITGQILEVATSSSDNLDEKSLKKEVYLVTYTVSGDRAIDPIYESVSSNLRHEQADAATQQQIWSYFVALIPADQRKIIAQYSIFTDGRGGTLAAVAQTQTDPAHWVLEVDVADIANIYDLTFTLIHEFGHLLTLGPDQVPPSLAVFNNPDDDNIYLKEASACPQYFPGEGCANSNSYINAFYNQFWANIHDEWNKINLEENEDIYNQQLDEFYNKYQDQFVTDYAVTNPEEDMAEAWAFFVLGPRPAGDTIAEKKILFFYQYPEIVQLRAKILTNLCRSFPNNR